MKRGEDALSQAARLMQQQDKRKVGVGRGKSHSQWAEVDDFSDLSSDVSSGIELSPSPAPASSKYLKQPAGSSDGSNRQADIGQSVARTGMLSTGSYSHPASYGGGTRAYRQAGSDALDNVANKYLKKKTIEPLKLDDSSGNVPIQPGSAMQALLEKKKKQQQQQSSGRAGEEGFSGGGASSFLKPTTQPAPLNIPETSAGSGEGGAEKDALDAFGFGPRRPSLGKASFVTLLDAADLESSPSIQEEDGSPNLSLGDSSPTHDLLRRGMELFGKEDEKEAVPITNEPATPSTVSPPKGMQRQPTASSFADVFSSSDHDSSNDSSSISPLKHSSSHDFDLQLQQPQQISSSDLSQASVLTESEEERKTVDNNSNNNNSGVDSDTSINDGGKAVYATDNHHDAVANTKSDIFAGVKTLEALLAEVEENSGENSGGGASNQSTTSTATEPDMKAVLASAMQSVRKLTDISVDDDYDDEALETLETLEAGVELSGGKPQIKLLSLEELEEQNATDVSQSQSQSAAGTQSFSSVEDYTMSFHEDEMEDEENEREKDKERMQKVEVRSVQTETAILSEPVVSLPEAMHQYRAFMQSQKAMLLDPPSSLEGGDAHHREPLTSHLVHEAMAENAATFDPLETATANIFRTQYEALCTSFAARKRTMALAMESVKPNCTHYVTWEQVQWNLKHRRPSQRMM